MVNSPIGVVYAIKRDDQVLGHLNGTLDLYPQDAEMVSQAALKALKDSTKVFQDFAKEGSMDHFWTKVPSGYFEICVAKMLYLVSQDSIAYDEAFVAPQGVYNKAYAIFDYVVSRLYVTCPVKRDDLQWLSGRSVTALSKVTDLNIEGKYEELDVRPLETQLADIANQVNSLYAAFAAGDVSKLQELYSKEPEGFGLPVGFKKLAATQTALKVEFICEFGGEKPFFICQASTLVSPAFAGKLKEFNLTLEQIR